jgi:hypothetical protein
LFENNREKFVADGEFWPTFSYFVNESIRVDSRCNKDSTWSEVTGHIFEESVKFIFVLKHVVNVELCTHDVKHKVSAKVFWQRIFVRAQDSRNCVLFISHI